MQRLSPVSLKQVLTRAPVGVEKHRHERKLFVQESASRVAGSLTDCIFNILFYIFHLAIMSFRCGWFFINVTSFLCKWLVFLALFYAVTITIFVLQQLGYFTKADTLLRFLNTTS